MRFRVSTLSAGFLVVGLVAGACTVESTDSNDDGGTGGTQGSAGNGTGGSGGDTGGSGGASSGSGGSGTTSSAAGAAGETSTTSGSGGMGEGGAGTGGTGGAPVTVDLIDCGSRDMSDATVVDSDITDDQTWSGTVYVDGRIDVYDGATLTIEAGTRVIMAVDSDIEFGWNSDQATVFAEGTADEPVRFCGEQEDQGFWRGLTFQQNVTSDSVLENVLIADAGGADQSLVLKADLLVDNVQVRNGANEGVLAADFDEDSQRLSVEGVEDVPVVLTGSAAITNFPLGGMFDNNGENTVHLRYTDLEDDTVFHDVGIPYVQEARVDVRNATLTFDAGVEVRFAADADLEVGWNNSDAIFMVNGTSAAPVVFRGAADDPGFWRGIILRQNVRTSSVIDHLEIRHAGGLDSNALRVESALTLQNVSVSDSSTGVYVRDQGLDPASTNLTITGVSDLPLVVGPNAVFTLPEGGAFTGNDTDQVGVEGGDLDGVGTFPNLGVPYRILADIDVVEGADVTLTPGTEFVMTADSDIEIGWNSGEVTFVAEGTEDAPIRFTGADEVAGFWPGLTVQSNALSGSKFDWVEIGHGGDACLTLRRPLPVTNSTFFDCEGVGILKLASDTSDYTESNSFEGVSASVADL